MSSKINGIDSNRTAPVGPGRAVERVKDAVSDAKDPSSAGAGGVDITGTARHLAALEKALASQPAVDEARVEAARSAIEQGRYTISSQRIADQLVQIERALGYLKG